jgi:uncharacterized protein (DUF58 family)
MESQLDLTQIHTLSNLEFIAKQVVEGFITGLHKSPFHGFSVEFAEHRLYNTGESTRHIDWKLYGRTEKLFIKRYEEETNLRCQIVIDTSSSMYFPEKEAGIKNQGNKLAFSVYCAAAFVEMLRKQRDAVGLTLFSDQVELHTPSKSSITHQKLLYSNLERLLQSKKPTTNKSTNAINAMHQVAENIHKRSLVIILSDMLDSSFNQNDLLAALQHLKHNKHEVILFHVSDKKHELDFEFDNRLYTFVDMETNEEVKLYPSQIKEHYVKSMNEYKKALQLKCGQYRIDFVEADINLGFQQVLLPFLIKRSKMK